MGEGNVSLFYAKGEGGTMMGHTTTVLVEGVVAGLNVLLGLGIFILGSGDIWIGIVPFFGGLLLFGEVIERVQSSASNMIKEEN